MISMDEKRKQVYKWLDKRVNFFSTLGAAVYVLFSHAIWSYYSPYLGDPEGKVFLLTAVPLALVSLYLSMRWFHERNAFHMIEIFFVLTVLVFVPNVNISEAGIMILLTASQLIAFEGIGIREFSRVRNEVENMSDEDIKRFYSYITCDSL